MRLTEAGQERFDRVRHAWPEWFDARLEDFTMTDPGDRARFDQALTDIAPPAGSPGRA
ncbi:hypothetical protein [Actinoplanes sp. HUAS TT8]|uniref:hypothetical protein n=1 Tax=Actinoplanes sp. HUAS TT8 TaxID=3447453 RepID=UPI003F51DD79